MATNMGIKKEDIPKRRSKDETGEQPTIEPKPKVEERDKTPEDLWAKLQEIEKARSS